MFQAIVTPGKRSNLGQHYTSVPNILKTIEPLFLDELKEEFEAAFDNPKWLKRLLDRIARIRFFDPACGEAAHGVPITGESVVIQLGKQALGACLVGNAHAT